MIKVKFITYHSQKGGVGKSSFSFYTALKLFLKGENVFLIDFDLTGTSLLDLKSKINSSKRNLNDFILKNPFYSENINIFDFFSTLKEPYLNTIKTTGNKTSPDINTLNIIAGSSNIDAIKIMNNFLYRENQTHYIRHKLEELINEIINTHLKNKDNSDISLSIIIDTPPGLVGVSELCFNMFNGKNKYKHKELNTGYDTLQIFICTTDEQDFNALIQAYNQLNKASIDSIEEDFKVLKNEIDENFLVNNSSKDLLTLAEASGKSKELWLREEKNLNDENLIQKIIEFLEKKATINSRLVFNKTSILPGEFNSINKICLKPIPIDEAKENEFIRTIFKKESSDNFSDNTILDEVLGL